MNILLTGATGYIGKRLLPVLVKNGHYIYCCVRDKKRFQIPESMKNSCSIIEIDLTEPSTLEQIPSDIDIAFYLVHSMANESNYSKIELNCAENFKEKINKTKINQVIYLSGMINDNNLSEHLQSRKNVETELSKGAYHFTCLRAGIIVGSGSASFEIIRDLVEKLPFMITPKWLLTKCQPIGISDVIKILDKCVSNEKVYDKNFDIGCGDILTYKEMLLQFAEVRKLKRTIWTVPVMTPRLSSYWLYFVTSTSFKLATSLVQSMKVEVICRDTRINNILGIEPISYKDSIRNAFDKLQDNSIVSSWRDSYISSGINYDIGEFINVPEFGTFKDKRILKVANKNESIKKIWCIGGKNGWYYGNWLWRIRGFLDKLVGGVGLRRGRTHPTKLAVGDALDFWRVIYSNKDEGRLLLFAEMKLPGEAWLEFKFINDQLEQIATFRPKGILGRLYWYSVYPFHGLIFSGLIKKISCN